MTIFKFLRLLRIFICFTFIFGCKSVTYSVTSVNIVLPLCHLSISGVFAHSRFNVCVYDHLPYSLAPSSCAGILMRYPARTSHQSPWHSNPLPA